MAKTPPSIKAVSEIKTGDATLNRLNKASAAGMKRATELEPMMVEVILPILDRAADKAAADFERRAVMAADGTWTAPATNELIDVPAVVAEMKEWFDPVLAEIARVVQEAVFVPVTIKTGYQGGNVEHVTGPNRARLRDAVDSADWSQSRPTARAEAAAAVNEPRNKLIGLRSRKPGPLLGIVAYRIDHDDEAVHVEHIASTGHGKGVGTRLMGEVAKIAAREGYGVAAAPTADSKGFFARIGMQPDTGLGAAAAPVPVDDYPSALSSMLTRWKASQAAGVADPSLMCGPDETLDSISVGAGNAVPRDVVDRIHKLGIDTPLKDARPTTDVGRLLTKKGLSTEDIYAKDGVWVQARKEKHEQWLAEHFKGKAPPAPGTQKHAYFTAGGGASGKGGAMFEVDGQFIEMDELAKRADVIKIDADEIKKQISEYTAMANAGDTYAASFVHEESSMLAKKLQTLAEEKGYHVILDSTGSTGKFLAKMGGAKALGYETQATMFSISTNDAITRAVRRGDKGALEGLGRYVYIEPLKEAHAGASRQLAEWSSTDFADTLDGWRVFDNTSGPKLVAEGGGGRIKIYDQTLWDAILAKAAEAG